MIDYKFETETRYFFFVQQVIFILTMGLPFVIIQSTELDSKATLPCLIISMCGNIFFAFIEFISIYE